MQAQEAFSLFRRDPLHSGLRFKKVHDDPAIYSSRVSLNYRALAARNGERVVWFWIGPHALYDRLLAQL